MHTDGSVILFLAVTLASCGTHQAKNPGSPSDGIKLTRDNADFPNLDIWDFPMKVQCLKVENVKNPLGMDIKFPRFSYRIESERRSEYQSAYRIIVASSQERLGMDLGDVWDTGKISSDRTNNIVYGGLSLKSETRYFWKVMVWNSHNEPSPWSSESAWFETGFLDRNEWRARWIGWDRGSESGFEMDNAKWIFHPDVNSGGSSLAGRYFFRKKFEVENKGSVRQAIFAGLAVNKFKVHINGIEIARGGWDESTPGGGKAFRFVDFTGHIRKGMNLVAIETVNDQENPTGLMAKIRITHNNGGSITFEGDPSWKTTESPDNDWKSPSYDDSGWQQSVVIGKNGDKPWGRINLPSLKSPAPMFRREFSINKKIIRARAYVSGLGYYELRINGIKVGDRVLDSPLSRYDKGIYYTTYDVTEFLKSGVNCIGLELGRGFYALKVANVWRWEKAVWNSEPKAVVQLNISFEDETDFILASDRSWKVTSGPTISDAIYTGDFYDARLEKSGWDKPFYDDGQWFASSELPPPSQMLAAHMAPAIKVIEDLRPVSLTNPAKGVFVFEMPKISAGWARLSASAEAGTAIKIKYGESLYPDGRVKAENGFIHEPDFQTDNYIFKGGGVEIWEPKFSYKGFLYVEISGFTGKLDEGSLTGRVVHSDVKITGEFASTNELLNRIHRNSVNSMLGNFHGIVTDTPMYEKNGWMGDAGLMVESAIYNFGMQGFFSKWLSDIRDSMAADGTVPVICPASGWGYSHSPEWATAYPFLVWNLYQFYGDTRIMADHYESLKKYIEYEISRLGPDMTSSSTLGDWLAPGHDGVAPEGPKITATSYVYSALVKIAKMAKLTGHPEDEERYLGIAEEVKTALNRGYLDKDNNQYITEKTRDYRQTSSVLPIAFGITPEEKKTDLIKRLVLDIEQRQGHLDTGILGTRYIFPVLSDFGQMETAYRIAVQRSYPSYGYLIDKYNASGNWESWEDNARSRNHHMYGSIDQWFYEYLAGIKPVSPGFKNLVVKPFIPSGLSGAHASVETINGRVGSKWLRNEDGSIELRILLPVNISAEIYVPVMAKGKILESGNAANKARNVTFLRMDGGYAVYGVGSGDYFFHSE
ncbi:MAG: family 78 glycoside hydrolase catalytic domain [Oligoflexales bacterium]|nr:family 78 glycoside hydrolase catalytic domain [Oligoflexales bacterium]